MARKKKAASEPKVYKVTAPHEIDPATGKPKVTYVPARTPDYAPVRDVVKPEPLKPAKPKTVGRDEKGRATKKKTVPDITFPISKPVVAPRPVSGGPSVKKDETTGKIRALTDAEKREARTKRLGTVPAPAQPRTTSNGQLPGTLVGKGVTPKVKGATSGNYKTIKAAVDAARTHLTGMQTNPVGSPEHHDAHEAFNAIHANVGQMHHGLHTLLGIAKHFVTNPGKGSPEMLARTHKEIDTTLDGIRQAHEDNLSRAAAGRAKKEGN